jgi:hypothetical protein
VDVRPRARGPPPPEEVKFTVRKLATRLAVATLTGLLAALTMSTPAFAGWKWG